LNKEFSVRKKLIIVGAVAAGASAAAKVRRMSEDVDIVLFESGPYMSFANCGLPYYLGGEIASRDSLLVVSEKMFSRRFNIDLRLNTHVTSVDAKTQAVRWQSSDGKSGEEHYDRLVLATGASAMRPPVAGLDRANVFTLRTIPDVDAVSAYIQSLPAGEAHSALVIGGGYIGLETAEQLSRRGLRATVVEMLPQIMGTMDAEMAEPIRQALLRNGCEVILGEGVARIEDRGGKSVAVTTTGREIPFDVGILATGIRPNVELAAAAGVKLGATGAIAVDEFQRTSVEGIYAAGDNCEYRHRVLGKSVYLPLAGPANKAGRAAGANAALDLTGASDGDERRVKLSGVLGSAIVRVFDTTLGVAGATETQLVREGVEYRTMYMPGASHATYYPGASRLLLKLLYEPAGGRLLGAQAVGGAGVDKRIDVLATAITAGMTLGDLEELDLCYAPPFSSAKDLEILGGFAGANALRGLMPTITPQQLFNELAGKNPPLVLDVRTQGEYNSGHLDGAMHIPVDELRGRIAEVPADRPVTVHCAAGYRSYVAQRMLMNHGRSNVRNILGGYGMIQQVRSAFAAGKK
jgi:NADPH-dependent 2,4-dienoyl-CoA reductase/sulfur reductase-like enzyme/rhodanese-related sulfurtransferase